MIHIAYTTKRQHYIPQMILKQHFVDFKDAQIPERYPYLWQYDKVNNVERKIYDVSKICYEKNLYEFKDDSGQITPGTCNDLENYLSKCESKWNIVLKRIISYKDQIEKVSIDDWALLFTLMVSQIMRTPEAIKYNTKYIQNAVNSSSKNSSEQYAKYISLVFEGIDNERNWMVSQLLRLMFMKNIIIGHTDKIFLLNGNRPVLIFSTANMAIRDATLYLPFNKHYCILMTPSYEHEENRTVTTNYYEFPEAFVKFLNQQNFENDGRFIYAGKKISMLVDC